MSPPTDRRSDTAATNEQRPLTLTEKRVIALYITGILLGVVVGFALAAMLWGLSEVAP